MSSTDHKWEPSERLIEIMSKDTVTPSEVREALCECFIAAHGDETIGLMIIKKQFIEAGVSFNNPTKDGLQKVMGGLKEVAVTFRDPQIIQKNYQKMMRLMNCCEEED